MTRRSGLTAALACALMAVLFQGCTIIRSEAPDIKEFDETRVEREAVHYRDVLVELGLPTNMSQLGDGMVWLYEDVDLIERQIGIGFDAWLLNIFKLNVGSGEGSYSGQLFVFDRQGNLVFAGRIHDDFVLGSGVGFQFIFTVSSLVDLGDVKMSATQNEWGRDLLKGLPESLNRGQDPDSGQHGVTLKVMPPFTGQNSLAAP